MELLVVILIIGILMGLLTAAIRKSFHYAQERRTTADIRTLEAACRAYRHEYGKWPLQNPDEADYSSKVSYEDNNALVVRNLYLTADGTSRGKNPNNINFLNLADYQTKAGDTILIPSSLKPFVFVFDLGKDSCSVVTNYP